MKEEKLVEVPKKKEAPARDTKKKASDENDSEAVENPSVKSRLESSKSKKKDDSVEEQSSDGEEEEGSSFQNRLKKSLD